MKIMKFGGTSVGKPERMKQVKDLITKDNEEKIVVLSALSGTTNALVGIGDAMAAGNKLQAKEIIEKLIAHYEQFINELLQSDEKREKARRVIHEQTKPS